MKVQVSIDLDELWRLMCAGRDETDARALLLAVAIDEAVRRDAELFDMLRALRAVDRRLSGRVAAYLAELTAALDAWARPRGRPTRDAPRAQPDRWTAVARLVSALGPGWHAAPSSHASRWHRARKDGSLDAARRLLEMGFQAAIEGPENSCKFASSFRRESGSRST